MCGFDRTVFINCPFDEEYAPLLEACLFVVVSAGLAPRLANERLDSGENRLDKIVRLIASAKFSIHDLSRCRDREVGAFSRMNMPFELGIDVGLRRSGREPLSAKCFLVFEGDRYDLKRALSDIAGQDVEAHDGDHRKVMKSVRDFLVVEAAAELPGPSRLEAQYWTFLGWLVDKKIDEGHSEAEALSLPTRERLDEMKAWVAAGRPAAWKA